jgi:hypothetical protein
MISNSKKQNLVLAKKTKNDEYYTRLRDIERELKNYKSHFKNKVVFCNCDDPEWSNFYIFFKAKMNEYGIKKLISTHYTANNLYDDSYKLECVVIEMNNGKMQETKTPLNSNGDFRTPECVDLLKQSDIVCTNPPFSLFREYISQLIEYEKKFLVIGNMNAVTYKDIFKLIKSNKLWFGVSPRSMAFITKEQVEKQVNAVWFTNLEHEKRNENIYLTDVYSTNKYNEYSNYDAIEIPKVSSLPKDFQGVMGVPITFLEKYNPEQFEILGLSASAGYCQEVVGIPISKLGDARPLINNKVAYARIFIKHKMGGSYDN